MNTINTAARQYANRPQDERFPSLSALVAQARYEKDHSKEISYNLKDLRAVTTDALGVATRTDDRPATTVALASPKGVAHFTHYSFGQLCRTIGAPAGYLRELPPTIAADAMNFGLQSSQVGATANLLVKANGGAPIVRAATSDSYGRVWDADLYGELERQFSAVDDRWTLPPTWDGKPAGAYRGDRDSFVILVNGGSIVKDPSLAGAAGWGAVTRQPNTPQTDGPSDGMYRGIMVRNSEVGHCSIVIESVLFRFICGNHMLWGAILDQTFRRRHIATAGDKGKITRETMRVLLKMARDFTQRAASVDEALIRDLIRLELAHTKEGTIDELRKIGATKEQAEAAYQTCERTEAASPRSFWGLAQGLTRNSQEDGWQDDRFKLDLLASQILRRGQLVAA